MAEISQIFTITGLSTYACSTNSDGTTMNFNFVILTPKRKEPYNVSVIGFLNLSVYLMTDRQTKPFPNGKSAKAKKAKLSYGDCHS